MADIFLSYSREDAATAKRMGKALEARGWSVWWDRRIAPGEDFRTHIQRQLNAARRIVVLWSNVSIASPFVRDEANQGMTGRLVPALIEDVTPPLGFGQLQMADLTVWRAGARNPEFNRLVEAIAAKLGQPHKELAERSDIASFFDLRRTLVTRSSSDSPRMQRRVSSLSTRYGSQSHDLGPDEAQTASALSALVPALSAGLRQNLQTPDGLSGLVGALSAGNHQRYVDNPAVLGDAETVADGNGILGHILGSQDVSRRGAAETGAQTGLGPE